ncbi:MULTISPECIES: hypothetical protein [unclassified Sphingomonas]|uniref:hypothetical protein n=1 Tax=unclassified Sphingomonas TaxID=196159 RepID=UPI0006FA2696|nr:MULTISPECIES: hypothetical protein [unclassified Sphingomonas]KQM57142.1 hypothetical protein ASE65_12435 [Sphingomonas sp. Leaf16]KQN10317.1 hypothetical protein ASE81_12480 [Sphingomonas sp. Leaf29]
MAKVDYDGFAGIHRLAEAEATIDQRSAVILTYHAALEREIDVVLSGLLPRPEKLRKNLGFANKIDVLAAAWRGEPEAGDNLHLVLRRFNDLRNSVAHGDTLEEVEGWLTKLIDAYRAIDAEVDVHVEVGELAQGICAYMADGPLPREVIAVADALDHLVNVTWPRAFGIGQQRGQPGDDKPDR